MADDKTPKAIDPEKRRAKDDALLADAKAALDGFEADWGSAVQVTMQDSINGGNCEPGVVAWRAAHAAARTSVPAQEMLQIAAQCRDQVPRVVNGVLRAIARVKAAR